MNRVLTVIMTASVACLSAHLVVAQTVNPVGGARTARAMTPAKIPAHIAVTPSRALSAPIPRDYTQMGQNLRSRLTPAGLAWAAQKAPLFRNGSIDEDQIRADASQSRDPLLASLGQGQQADIEALVFVVMFQVAQDARSDQRDVLTQVQAANTARREGAAEMGEEGNLRMQLAMDRMSKMMTVLSNILKKTSDTSSSIIQNVK
jgi:hypothetical protein